MISDRSIQDVKDKINIVDLLSTFIEIKKRGATYVACCPFHNEKSPSFTVSEIKGSYHCFGCGKSGDAIQFVIEHEKLDFVGAIEYIANYYNISLQLDKSPEVSKEIKDEMEQMRKVMQAAQVNFQKSLLDIPYNHPVVDYLLEERGFKPETIMQFGFGFAPGEKFITDKVIAAGLYTIAEKLGLVGNKDGRNYDKLRNRWTVPIYDHRGQLVGLGARDLSGSKNAAKYLNSPDSRIYNKSKVLYGLNWAAKSIKENGYAILTEGYADVITCHQGGIDNTVASCGTALTDDQAKLIAKYTSTIIILRDSDAAGKKATLKDIDVLARNNLNVKVVNLPEGEDPDSFIRNGNDLRDYISKTQQDGIEFKCINLITDVADKDDAVVAINNIVQFLCSIKNAIKREIYVKSIGAIIKEWIKPATFAAEIKKYIQEIDKEEAQFLEEDDIFLPPEVDREEYMRFGFYELEKGAQTGYWFASGTRSNHQISNFIIKPLFHIYSKQDNKRMIEINNGYNSKIIEMSSKSMISLDAFASAAYDEGYYIFEGTKQQLMKINSKIGDQFPLCYELKTLGWQPEGFFAYSNAVVHNTELIPFDEMGIVDIKETKFLSLAVSRIQKDVRADEDIYENDRYLTHSPSPIDFSQWADLMHKVYGQHGWIGASYALSTLFRDIIINVSKLPHLYAYGGVGAGKSEFGDSISNLFFNQMPAFNLNQGTDFAFWSRMERFRNCPNALNEFDEYGIKDEWFRGIKSVYDLEGREKGRGLKEKTKTQKANCTIILMGQYLSTKDDNSVLTRCIPLAFKEEKNRPQELIDNFTLLKSYEKKGLSGCLVEVMKLRPLVKSNYAESFSTINKRMMDDLTKMGKAVKSRILKNICAPLALMSIVMEGSTVDPSYSAKRLKLPFSFEEFYEKCKEMIISLSDIISESNALSEFWKYVEYMLDRNLIQEEFDYKVEVHNSVTIVKDGESFKKQFDKPEKLLFIRINGVHKHYQNSFRTGNGKNGMNEQTLMTYIRDQSYFIGMNPGSNFMNEKGKKVSTSSYVLLYNEIGVNLERSVMEDDREEAIIKGQLFKDAELMTTGDVIMFTVMSQVNTTPEAAFPKYETQFVKCFIKPQDNWQNELKQQMHIEVTGMLAITKKYDKTFRSMDLVSYKLLHLDQPTPQTNQLNV